MLYGVYPFNYYGVDHEIICCRELPRSGYSAPTPLLPRTSPGQLCSNYGIRINNNPKHVHPGQTSSPRGCAGSSTPRLARRSPRLSKR